MPHRSADEVVRGEGAVVVLDIRRLADIGIIDPCHEFVAFRNGRHVSQRSGFGVFRNVENGQAGRQRRVDLSDERIRGRQRRGPLRGRQTRTRAFSSMFSFCAINVPKSHRRAPPRCAWPAHGRRADDMEFNVATEFFSLKYAGMKRFEWPTFLVVSYTLLGWPFGIWMLTRPETWLNAVGVLLIAHTLVYSAYVIHDCAHHAVFATATGNDRLGVLMSWVNGACIASYPRLKKKHLRHHSDRLDGGQFGYL